MIDCCLARHRGSGGEGKRDNRDIRILAAVESALVLVVFVKARNAERSGRLDTDHARQRHGTSRTGSAGHADMRCVRRGRK